MLKTAALATLGAISLHAYSEGPPPRHTGGFGEPNCAACHIGPVNRASGRVTILRPDVYTPGQSVPITVNIQDTDPGRNRWGFQMSARFRDGRQAGRLLRGANTEVVTSNSVQYAYHAPAQFLTGNSYTYTLTWEAPADSSSGDVIFNAAANAANGNGIQDSDDHIFLTEAAALAPGMQPARIGAGGIVDAASFTPAPNNIGAPGALISLFGENVAPGTAAAVALPLPTALLGTQVLFNGVAAPLIFVSPGQINAQVPFAAQITSGSSASVQVQISHRPASNTEALRIEAVAPGIFTQNARGSGPAAALRANTSVIIGPNGPARPGEVVEIYVAGLGQTNPPLASGAAGNAQLTVQQPTVTIGGQNASVGFSGASPCCAGLYQINVIIPNLAAGDHEIVITIGGRQAQRGATLSVRP